MSSCIILGSNFYSLMTFEWLTCLPVVTAIILDDLQVMSIKQTALTKKKDSLRAMALDSENNQIQVKDIVKVIDGPHSVSQHSNWVCIPVLRAETLSV